MHSLKTILWKTNLVKNHRLLPLQVSLQHSSDNSPQYLCSRRAASPQCFFLDPRKPPPPDLLSLRGCPLAQAFLMNSNPTPKLVGMGRHECSVCNKSWAQASYKAHNLPFLGTILFPNRNQRHVSNLPKVYVIPKPLLSPQCLYQHHDLAQKYVSLCLISVSSSLPCRSDSGLPKIRKHA